MRPPGTPPELRFVPAPATRRLSATANEGLVHRRNRRDRASRHNLASNAALLKAAKGPGSRECCEFPAGD